MAGLGGTELLVVLAVLLLLFGSSQVPKMARALGSARHEFEKGQEGETDGR